MNEVKGGWENSLLLVCFWCLETRESVTSRCTSCLLVWYFEGVCWFSPCCFVSPKSNRSVSLLLCAALQVCLLRGLWSVFLFIRGRIESNRISLLVRALPNIFVARMMVRKGRRILPMSLLDVEKFEDRGKNGTSHPTQNSFSLLWTHQKESRRQNRFDHLVSSTWCKRFERTRDWTELSTESLTIRE